MIIDAYGKQCPLPLVLAKKEIDAGRREFGVAVDNETAVENLRHLADKTGLTFSVEEQEGGFLVQFLEGEKAVDEPIAARVRADDKQAGQEPSTGFNEQGIQEKNAGYAVFISKDRIGEGSFELGGNLMRMALFTLAESDDPPSKLLFMNEGVKLVAGDDKQVIESVEKIVSFGSEVLVCGTCLDYYGLKEQLKVGQVSNMYDILSSMKSASKIISW